MKKFLSKLPVMIALWCVTAVLLTVMIVMAARPVSYGWAYKGDDKDVLGLGEEQEIALVFDDEDELEMFIELEGLSFEMEIWYLREGKKYGIVAPSSMPPLVQDYMGDELMTEREFEEYVRECKSDRQIWRDMWASADDINAFKCEMYGEEFVCTGAIVFTVIFGVLVVAGLTFSTFSTAAFVKGKKSKKSDTPNDIATSLSNKVEGQIEIEELQQ